MSELDFLRSLPFDIDLPTEEARDRARGRLLRHTRRSRIDRRRRLLVPAIALAAAGLIAVFVDVGNHGGGSASAAPVLRKFAAIARDQAVGHGNSTDSEMFTLVGDALRESDASPALRAALYEVAARIPGVELIGPAVDRVGRHGVAVASVDSKIGLRHELIFGRKTAALLGEEYVELEGNADGYPVGAVSGYATYVTSAVVDRLGARP